MTITKLEPGKTVITEEIKSSSSNNVYAVTLYDNCISCTCPAGGKKSLCKHMIKVIHDNMESLQKDYPNFYKLLSDALIMKNDKYKDANQYKKLLEQIIYVNRQIAEKSHNNAKVIDKHPERTETIRFRVTEEEKQFLKAALYDFRKYGKYNGTWDKNLITFELNIDDLLDYIDK